MDFTAAVKAINDLLRIMQPKDFAVHGYDNNRGG
jgi:NADPH-dependent 7-cyano-7-deazaguanine reductase QueF